MDSANVSIVDLRASLNHMSIVGIPDTAAVTSSQEFCEDCERQKLQGLPLEPSVHRFGSSLTYTVHQPDVFDGFRKYKAWAENVTGCRIGVLRDDKGSEYMSGAFGSFLVAAGTLLYGCSC